MELVDNPNSTNWGFFYPFRILIFFDQWVFLQKRMERIVAYF